MHVHAQRNTVLQLQPTYVDVVLIMKVQRLFEIVMRVPLVDVARPMLVPLKFMKIRIRPCPLPCQTCSAQVCMYPVNCFLHCSAPLYDGQ